MNYDPGLFRCDMIGQKCTILNFKVASDFYLLLGAVDRSDLLPTDALKG